MKKVILANLMAMFMFNIPLFSQDKNNPLLQDWKTPYETPPFNEIKNEHYKPAIEYAIKVARKEIDNIANNKTAPDFENTILALENSGLLLSKVYQVFKNLNECNTNTELQKLALEISPVINDFINYKNSNEKLFERVKVVYSNVEKSNLTLEQKMLLDKTYQSFARGGALLTDKTDKKKFQEVTKELSVLSLQFKQNVLADNNNWFLHITNEYDLKGLPKMVAESAKEAAKKKNLEGWVFTLDAPSFMPFMQYSFRRSLREQMWRAYNNRGNRGNENDNNEIIRKIADLRLQMANLLGYKTYADYVLSDRMAENSDNVNKFLDNLLTTSLPYAKKDVQEVQDFAKNEGATFEMERWDWTYFSEALKEQKYSINQQELREYFQIDNVREGIFKLFGKLYGLSFTERKDIPVYQEDVVAYEVKDKDRFMGILYLDMFPRPAKRNGAWVVTFRDQHKQNAVDTRPILQIVCNFSKPTETTPSLLMFREMETFLHEFGHAIHILLSDVNYESISGASVYRDFVELPSQLMENWSTQKEFLDMFAVHYKTGKPIPQNYIDKIVTSQQYNAGYTSVRQLSFGILDMAYHSIKKPLTGSITDFEHAAISKTELLPIINGAKISTAFAHIFAGGYASGYYGYKWAEVLDADVFSVFLKEGIFNQDVAKRFRESILSKGGTAHPMTLYKNFMSREPNIEPLLIRSGFVEEIEK